MAKGTKVTELEAILAHFNSHPGVTKESDIGGYSVYLTRTGERFFIGKRGDIFRGNALRGSKRVTPRIKANIVGLGRFILTN